MLLFMSLDITVFSRWDADAWLKIHFPDSVVIGGQMGIIGHIEIDDTTMIGAQTGTHPHMAGKSSPASPTGRRLHQGTKKIFPV